MLDFLAYLELERGHGAQHARSPTAPTCSSSAPSSPSTSSTPATRAAARRSEFLTALATGNGDGPAATATIQRKAALPALLLPPPAARGRARLRPDRSALDAAPSQKLPNVLGRAEVQRLLEQPKGTEPIALRDRALLELMYACGLRASEVIDLELSQVDLDERHAARARARARRSGSCRSAGSPCARCATTCGAAGPQLVGRAARSRACSSTSAAGR